MAEPNKVEIAAAPISKNVYVHDLAQPRSARTNSKITLVVTNRNHVQLKKLRADAQHDYEMKIDAVDMLPEAFEHTWKHAGLPPDGEFITENEDATKWRLPPYFDELMVLVTTACNLVMPMAALSYYDQTPAEVEGRLESTEQLPPGRALISGMTYSETPSWHDELDEGRMSYVLGMLVRLFYRGDGETDERNWREQELRKAIVHYLSGTGGTSQFTNFTSLFMSLELAVAFAKSMRIRPDDEIHKHAAALLGDAVRGSGIDPTNSKSRLVKACLKTLDKAMAGRINEYSKINGRLKHYGRDANDTKYFNNIVGRMRRLRADAAYAILLGLERSCGTGSPPALPSKSSRTSQVILNMIEDCVDRHGAEHVDGGMDAKIRWFADFIENDAIRSEKVVYDNACLVLGSLETLVRAARMLDMPDGLAGVHALAHEFKDAVPDNLKPSKMELDVEHDEEALCAWLEYVTYSIVAWMDDQFYNMYVRLHVARYGRTSGMKCDPDRF